MEEPGISQTSVDAAITASLNALDKDEMAWIRKSIMFKRAYFMGLYSGLSAITSEDNLKSLYRIFLELIISRAESGDDTFLDTRLGNEFLLFKNECHNKPNSADIDNLAKRLNTLIEEHDQHWNLLVKDAHKIIDKIITFKHRRADLGPHWELDHEYHTFIDSIEKTCRKISLLETDHTLAQRLNK